MRQLSKGIFPSGNFPTVKFPKLQPPAAALGPYPALAAALDPPIAACGASIRRPNLTFGNLLFGKLHNWEIVTWEVALGK